MRCKLGEKKIKRLREKTGLPIVNALTRGGTFHRIDLCLANGLITELYTDGTLRKTQDGWNTEGYEERIKAVIAALPEALGPNEYELDLFREECYYICQGIYWNYLCCPICTPEGYNGIKQVCALEDNSPQIECRCGAIFEKIDPFHSWYDHPRALHINPIPKESPDDKQGSPPKTPPTP